MNHGDIIEQGTHEGLLEKGGFYADLYNSQFTSSGASVDDILAHLPEEKRGTTEQQPVS